MLKLTTGDLLAADAEALVNTVNCVGVMGKGIALQFKQTFPANFVAYERACKAKEMEPGRMHVFETMRPTGPRFIVNFPTKRHWKGKSKIEDIKSGLAALVAEIRVRGIRSIAVPPLGCGAGGLDWADVHPLIDQAFRDLPDVEVLVFAPAGAPSARAIQVNTDRPHLTRARALMICLIGRYYKGEEGLTSVVVQKLAYFLQAVGEPMKFKFAKHHYGPYADNLNHVLQRLEGHYITGYGARDGQRMDLDVLPGAMDEAMGFLVATEPDAIPLMDRVFEVIAGFESPYGLELMATVHWVAAADALAAREPGVAVREVQSWSARKNDLFGDEHIRIVWDRLREEGLLR